MLQFQTDLTIKLDLILRQNISYSLTILTKEPITKADCRTAVGDAFDEMLNKCCAWTAEQFALEFSQKRPDWDVIFHLQEKKNPARATIILTQLDNGDVSIS